jgi:hypothetical protein
MQMPAHKSMMSLHFDAALMQFRKLIVDEKNAEDAMT